MRIAVHSYVYHPEQFLVNELSTALVSRGHTVQVYTGLPNYPQGQLYAGYSLLKGPYRELWMEHEIVRYPIVPRRKGFKFLAVNYLSHICMGVLNLGRLKTADVHFVFATSPITIAIPAVIKARLTGAKVCIWLQDLWPDSVAAVGAIKKESHLYRILGAIVRMLYRHVDIVMIQSPAFRSNLVEYGYKKTIFEVPNWAPSMGDFEGTIPEWLQNFPKNDFVITFAGNIGKAQAIMTILEAALILKNISGVRFVFVGDGSQKSDAESFVSKHDLKNVIFMDRRPIGDMPALFKMSSALLVSLSDDVAFSQTLPSKVQAYMSAGKPILGSLSGVGAEVIAESRGGVVSPALDSKALAANIFKLLELGEEALSEMGRCAYAYYLRNYVKDNVISRIDGILRDNSPE